MISWQYNERAMNEGWGQFPALLDINKEGDATNRGHATIECIVKYMIKDTYGKMGEPEREHQILMEYEYLLETFANSTYFAEGQVEPETWSQF